ILWFYAFAEGGIFGGGLGNSCEKFLYLPEAETDFIFAIIGEELGLIGALVVIMLFLVFLYAGVRIARTAPDNLGAMIAGSFTIMVVFQAFLNIGCVLGLLPTTGKPLPFISSGGSSLIACLFMVGFILSVSQHSAEPSVYEQRRQDLRVVRAQPPGGSSRSRSGQGASRPHSGSQPRSGQTKNRSRR
ncbi:MAG: FtsW/RodA/SpoVE family cell cycle protein, partial [Raoultibacter sp.]